MVTEAKKKERKKRKADEPNAPLAFKKAIVRKDPETGEQTTQTFYDPKEFKQALGSEAEELSEQRLSDLRRQRVKAKAEAGEAGLGTGVNNPYRGLSDEEFSRAIPAGQEQILEKLRDVGAFETAPTDTLDPVTDTRKINIPLGFGRDISLGTEYVPGLSQAVASITSDYLTEYGLSESEMETLKEQNPERAEEVALYLQKAQLERKNRVFSDKLVDAFGALTEGLGVDLPFIEETKPIDRIKKIEGTLGLMDSFQTTQEGIAKDNPFEALENLNRQEDELKLLEARLQLLIRDSHTIQTAPEELNNVKTKLKIYFNRINGARTNIRNMVETGQVQGLTPTERRLLIEKIQKDTKKLKNITSENPQYFPGVE